MTMSDRCKAGETLAITNIAGELLQYLRQECGHAIASHAKTVNWLDCCNASISRPQLCSNRMNRYSFSKIIRAIRINNQYRTGDIWDGNRKLSHLRLGCLLLLLPLQQPRRSLRRLGCYSASAACGSENYPSSRHLEIRAALAPPQWAVSSIPNTCDLDDVPSCYCSRKLCIDDTGVIIDP